MLGIDARRAFDLTQLGGSGTSLQWRHNEHDGVSDHQRLDCLLNRLFRPKSKKISKLRALGLCEGKSPLTGEFPTQKASGAENASIWWRHHDLCWNEMRSTLPKMWRNINRVRYFMWWWNYWHTLILAYLDAMVEIISVTSDSLIPWFMCVCPLF